MASKPKTASTTKPKTLAEALAAAGHVNADRATPKLWLSTGNPVLNHRISGKYRSGGFPMGRVVEIFGGASSGKTLIATSAMIAAQKAGGVAIFMDHERSFDERLAERLGLSTDPNVWVYDKPDTFEQSFDKAITIMELIRSGEFGIEADAPICLVFDSLASMVPQSKWDKSLAEYNMHDNTALARATSAAFPAFTQHVEQDNCLAIFLNQTREDIKVTQGDKTKTPGGNSPEFYASIRLKLTGGKIYDEAKKVYTGKHINAETVKNKTHRPFQKAEWDAKFEEDGFLKLDVIGAVLEELKELGILTMSGAYIEWEGKKLYKSVLTKQIEDGGPEALEKLLAMLPN